MHRTKQHGRPGHHCLHGRQRQGKSTVTVVNVQFGDVEFRPQAVPAGADAADGDLLADHARNGAFHLRGIHPDVGQDPVAQAEKDRGKREIHRHGHPADDAQHDAPAGMTTQVRLDRLFRGPFELNRSAPIRTRRNAAYRSRRESSGFNTKDMEFGHKLMPARGGKARPRRKEAIKGVERPGFPAKPWST